MRANPRLFQPPSPPSRQVSGKNVRMSRRRPLLSPSLRRIACLCQLVAGRSETDHFALRCESEPPPRSLGEQLGSGVTGVTHQRAECGCVEQRADHLTVSNRRPRQRGPAPRSTARCLPDRRLGRATSHSSIGRSHSSARRPSSSSGCPQGGAPDSRRAVWREVLRIVPLSESSGAQRVLAGPLAVLLPAVA